jgi:hypothetical protein
MKKNTLGTYSKLVWIFQYPVKNNIENLCVLFNIL